MRLFNKSSLIELSKKKASAVNLLKGLTAFLLLSCLLVDPIAGTFTWLSYQKTLVKKQVKSQIDEGIDKGELVLLKFSKEEIQTELRWEHSREFEYNRKMYDIVETKAEGNTVYYWCWYDHKETMLNRHLEELASKGLKGSPDISEELALVIAHIKSLYCTFPIQGDVPVPEFLNTQFCLFSYVDSQIIFQPPTPPPRLS